MTLKFNISIGTENIKKDIDPQELIRMHKFVAPSVGETMIGNWRTREEDGKCEYFCASIEDLDRNPSTISMISGIIKDNNLVIMNTATDDKLREKGYFGSLVGKTVLAINEQRPEVTNFHGMFSTGKEVPKDLDVKFVLDKVSTESQEINQEKEKTISNAFSSSIEALQQSPYTSKLSIEQKDFNKRHPNLDRFSTMVDNLNISLHPKAANSPWGARGINLTPFTIKDQQVLDAAKKKSDLYPTEQQVLTSQSMPSHQIKPTASGWSIGGGK